MTKIASSTQERRPSHADRRNALRRNCIEQAFREAQAHRPLSRNPHSGHRPAADGRVSEDLFRMQGMRFKLLLC